MTRSILLSFSLWQTYSDFYLLWRKTGGVGLSTAVCEANGIARGNLGRLRALGAVTYVSGVALWWPARGVRVEAQMEDGPKAIQAKMKHRGQRRHFNIIAGRERLQAVTDLDEGERIVAAAKAEGVTISAWLRDAARQKLEAGE